METKALVMVWKQSDRGGSLHGRTKLSQRLDGGRRESLLRNCICCRDIKPDLCVFFWQPAPSVSEISRSVYARRRSALTRWFIKQRSDFFFLFFFSPSAVIQLLNRCCLYQFRSYCIVCQRRFGISFVIKDLLQNTPGWAGRASREGGNRMAARVNICRIWHVMIYWQMQKYNDCETGWKWS